MGTRADFYVGRGLQAEWLGSIAWDGYPEGLPIDLFHQRDEADWRASVESFFQDREDVTRPAQGWPWPWPTSHTTDYSYAFDGGMVWACCFGHAWFDPNQKQPDDDSEDKLTIFPDMTARQKVTMGKRSGVIVVGPHGPIDGD